MPTLEEKMKSAGMTLPKEYVAGVPFSKFLVHKGVDNLEHYEQWLEMRLEELVKLQAYIKLGEVEKDLEEWADAGVAFLSESLGNFRQATGKIKC